MEPSPSARMLWAKTPGNDRDLVEQRLWLSLVQHCRDAGDVGARLFELWLPVQLQDRLDAVSGGFGRQLTGWSAAVHDIGKAQLLFQAQIDGSMHTWQWEQVQDLSETPAIELDSQVEKPHSIHSELILRRLLSARWPDSQDHVQATLTASAGAHHGKPSRAVAGRADRNPERRAVERWLDQHGVDWHALWDEIFDDALERSEARPALDHVLAGPGLSASDQLLLAGLVTMADWIASNENFFPLTRTGMHSSAETRAENALDRLNLTRAWGPGLNEEPDLQRRFAWPPEAKLRPAQASALDVVRRLPAEPSLLIFEMETGGGKTELAFLAAEILAAVRGSGGIALALPTMATSDAMFTRAQRWVQAISAEDEQLHSLYLGHSRARLHQGYEELIEATRNIDANGDGAASAQGSVIAHQWLRGRRRGLLSEFVVCTVDQVLMMALATKHVALRHLGLAGKVVIVDEVHSYDVYSSSYLRKALEWLAAQGSSVILLSATLASGQRQELVSAYQKGLTAPETPAAKPAEGRWNRRRKDSGGEETQRVSFPRLTTVTAGEAVATALPDRAGHRNVVLRAIDDDVDALLRELAVLHQDGGIAGIVCNTVRRAQQVYEWAVAEFGPQDVELLHSQFTALDRAAREQRLVELIGPKTMRGHGRPHRRIIVGTQVLEQSLDVDFDLLVTDLAPTDALAQRAGRLHRHDRPAGDRPTALQTPSVLVRGVNREAMADTAPELEPGAEAIYGAKILLDTLAVMLPLLGGGTWCLRHDVPHSVELTYQSPGAAVAAWGIAYEDAVQKAEERENSARRAADAFQLKSVRDSSTLERALQAMTVMDVERDATAAEAHVRDIRPTLEVLLVQQTKFGALRVLPWLTDGDPELQVLVDETQLPPLRVIDRIARSAVRLPQSLASVRDEASFDRAIDELERQTPVAWGQHHLLKGQLMLTIDEELCGQVAGRRFRYDPELGIQVLGGASDE
ncbi:CRISPR-associated helicase Cas3' [Kocuria sp.]|uniref:CRISPR-associated helicase Cas3' n=1 Tax=Kocuria sp. TaxID=1871328 RepID=UPI0026DFA4F8|nr:CRISPR-associated helicase Cas3' [Kocuria sp.]MDO5617953.1 CRISPR-associated helicase Cas3' [Kocuria sp.]